MLKHVCQYSHSVIELSEVRSEVGALLLKVSGSKYWLDLISIKTPRAPVHFRLLQLRRSFNITADLIRDEGRHDISIFSQSSPNAVILQHAGVSSIIALSTTSRLSIFLHVAFAGCLTRTSHRIELEAG